MAASRLWLAQAGTSSVHTFCTQEEKLLMHLTDYSLSHDLPVVLALVFLVPCLVFGR